MKVIDYTRQEFVSSCGETQQFSAFARLSKSELSQQLKIYGITLKSFSKGHFEWSAVLEKDGKYIYVRMSDVRYTFNWYDGVLIRTMKHASDYIGGDNHFCSFNEIGQTAHKMFQRGY